MVYTIYLDTSLEHCLKGQKNSKTHLLRENQMIISILSNAILPDFAEKSVDIQTRGGLKKVVDEAREMFILAEQLFHKTAETSEKN